MEKLRIKDIADAASGRLVNIREDAVICGISTDSRRISKGDLFIALSGENFDGHNFAKQCIEGGAMAALVSRELEEDIPQIVVSDTKEALKDIARYYRNMFSIPFIAVTGSTGKTSTKEMIASVLEEEFNVHKTQKNFNNEIGLPLTIFDLNFKHNISVLEMGMNNSGEIERLSSIGRPDISVITNVGTAHIENLGSRENILKAKMEITKYFNRDSILIINSDDDMLSTIDNKEYSIIKVSINNKGDFTAYNIKNYGESGVEFSCIYKDREELFKINVPGIHNVYNALAAIAIANEYNMDVNRVKAGIAKFKPGKMRMDIIEVGDIKIINDCYNANLDSMKSSLSVLSSFKGNRRIAVLGDMFELGEFTEEAHRKVGEYSADKCDLLIAVGEASKFIYESAGSRVEAHYFKTREEACDFLKNSIKPGDVILVKASRGMKMEMITNFIIEDKKRGN